MKDRKNTQLASDFIAEGQTLDHNIEEKRKANVLSDEAKVEHIEKDDRAEQDKNLAARLRDRLRAKDLDEAGNEKE